MKTAVRIKKAPNMSSDAVLFKVSPPHEGHDYLVASAATVPFSGPETYLFGADADGHITNWAELEGSFRGGLSHSQALTNAGYTIVED